MKKRFDIRGAAICFTAMAALNICSIASAQDAGKKITGIAAGSDYLTTAQGTQTTLATGAVVPLQGVPIPGMGSADTQIIREKDAGLLDDESPDFTKTIPIKMVSLNMSGTVGGCTVSITLAPTPASTGKMTITTTSPTGGTFYSTLNVHYIAMFTPAATCPKTTKGSYTFGQKGGAWTTIPSAGAFIVSGPYGATNANQHTGLPPGIVDFYILGNGEESAATANHVVCAAFAAAGTPCP